MKFLPRVWRRSRVTRNCVVYKKLKEIINTLQLILSSRHVKIKSPNSLIYFFQVKCAHSRLYLQAKQKGGKKGVVESLAVEPDTVEHREEDDVQTAIPDLD